MTRALELIGNRFGRWTVVARADTPSGKPTRWLCRCDCGRERQVLGASLTGRRSRSCSCLRGEQVSERLTTHGMSSTPEHATWRSMRARCTNPRATEYERYGGRGITFDPRWNSFEAFLADMGPKPSPKHSIERLDLDGNYTPGNCVWATSQVQARNTSRNLYLTHEGSTLTVAEWAERTGIAPRVLYMRVYKGWPVDRVLTEPALGRTRVSADDVREIRSAHAAGTTCRDLADRFGVSSPAISQIVHRRTWRHVT